QGAAIGFGPESRRSPRAVVAGLVLRLEDQHGGLPGDLGGKARARHSGADDRHVVSRHRAVSSRNLSMVASASRRIGSASRNISWAASGYILSSARGSQRAASRIAAALTSRSWSAPIRSTGSSTAARRDG